MWGKQQYIAILSPAYAYQLASRLQWYFAFCALALLLPGLFVALKFSPPDYQQGDTVRLMYLHVPLAFASLLIYLFMSGWSLVYFVWHIKVADAMAEVAAGIGAWCTLLCLITGSLWGKPTWGTFWIWDARLTSELILFFIYLGIIALRQSIAHVDSAGRVCSLMTLIGLVNIPIVHYSVVWWNTLHQGSSLSFTTSSIAWPLLKPLLLMMPGLFFLLLFAGCLGVRARLLERESKAVWARVIIGNSSG